MNDAIRLEVERVGPEGYDEFWDTHRMHYDRRGNPLTFREWVMLYEKRDYQVVKQEHVGSYLISTVWLGLDHGFRPGRGAPVIFETMVFNEALPKPPPISETLERFERFREDPESGFDYPEMTSSTDLDCQRYSTEEQALAGHKAMAEKVKLIVEATS